MVCDRERETGEGWVRDEVGKVRPFVQKKSLEVGLLEVQDHCCPTLRLLFRDPPSDRRFTGKTETKVLCSRVYICKVRTFTSY